MLGRRSRGLSPKEMLVYLLRRLKMLELGQSRERRSLERRCIEPDTLKDHAQLCGALGRGPLAFERRHLTADLRERDAVASVVSGVRSERRSASRKSPA